MIRRVFISFVIFWEIVIACGCFTVTVKPSQKQPDSTPISGSWRCEQVPSTFQETDLAGTWQTIFGTSRIDTLYILETGDYLQVFEDKSTGYYYESESQKWWIEKRDDGGIYIHLIRMLFCGGVRGCINPEEESLGFYDFCADRWFDMKGEFILAVDGNKDVPRGIQLRHMRPAGFDAFFYNYTLVEK